MKLIDLYSKMSERPRPYRSREIQTGVRSRDIDDTLNIGVYDKTAIIAWVIGWDKNRKRQGTWKEFWRNGNLKEISNYENDEMHGKWKKFWPNGNLQRIGNYKNGKEYGEWRYFDENGDLKKTENYYKNEVD